MHPSTLLYLAEWLSNQLVRLWLLELLSFLSFVSLLFCLLSFFFREESSWLANPPHEIPLPLSSRSPGPRSSPSRRCISQSMKESSNILFIDCNVFSAFFTERIFLSPLFFCFWFSYHPDITDDLSLLFFLSASSLLTTAIDWQWIRDLSPLYG